MGITTTVTWTATAVAERSSGIGSNYVMVEFFFL